MTNKVKQNLLILTSCILAFQSSLAFAIENQYSNQLLKLNFDKSNDGNVNVTLYSSKQYKLKVTPIKRGDGKYIILLPETYHSLTSKPDVSATKGAIKDVDVKLVPYVGYSNNGYTKIEVKTGDNVRLNVNNTSPKEESNLTDDLSKILSSRSRLHSSKVAHKTKIAKPLPQKIAVVQAEPHKSNQLKPQKSTIKTNKIANTRPLPTDKPKQVKTQPIAASQKELAQKPQQQQEATTQTASQPQEQPQTLQDTSANKNAVASHNNLVTVDQAPLPSQNRSNPLLALFQKLLIAIIAVFGIIYILKRRKKNSSNYPQKSTYSDPVRTDSILERLSKTKNQNISAPGAEVSIDSFINTPVSNPQDDFEFVEVKPDELEDNEEDFIAYLPDEDSDTSGFSSQDTYQPAQEPYAYEEVSYSNDGFAEETNSSEEESYLPYTEEIPQQTMEAPQPTGFDDFIQSEQPIENNNYFEELTPPAPPQDDEPEFLNAYEISKDKGLYLITMDEDIALIGVINSEVFLLNTFRNLKYPTLIVKDNGSSADKDLYAVKVGNWRSLVSVTANEINVEYVY